MLSTFEEINDKIDKNCVTTTVDIRYTTTTHLSGNNRSLENEPFVMPIS